MEITLNIPERVVERAARLGLTVEALIGTAVDGIEEESGLKDEFWPVPAGFQRLGTPCRSRSEATATIREIARGHSLDGVTVKELIEEGRRW